MKTFGPEDRSSVVTFLLNRNDRWYAWWTCIWNIEYKILNIVYPFIQIQFYTFTFDIMHVENHEYNVWWISLRKGENPDGPSLHRKKTAVSV